MAFVKPSSVSTQSGSYQYKGGLASSSLNYIDNNFPNIVDGVNGGTISGLVTVTSTGEIKFQSGSTLLTQSGSSVSVNGTMNVASGATLTTSSGATVTLNGPITSNGIITVNDALHMAIGADANFGSASFINGDSSNMYLCSSGEIQMQDNVGNTWLHFSHGTDSILFDSSVVAPTIGQNNTSSLGNLLTISGQNTTGHNQTGGTVTIMGGGSSGTGTTFGGDVDILGGVSNNGGSVGIFGGQGVSTPNGGSVSIGNQNIGTVVSLASDGISFPTITAVSTTSGNRNITSSEVANPYISLGTITLTGTLTIIFPTSNVARIFFVSGAGVTYSGHSIFFKCGTITSSYILNGSSSPPALYAIVFIDENNNIAVSNGG